MITSIIIIIITRTMAIYGVQLLFNPSLLLNFNMVVLAAAFQSVAQTPGLDTG